MAMQIHGNYDHSGTDYAERVKEKQADQRAEKVKEAEKAAEEKNAGKLSEPRDEYISRMSQGDGHFSVSGTKIDGVGYTK